MKKDFLWGASNAAHQIEGGLKGTTKGLSVSDVVTSGSATKLREITTNIDEGKYYPNHEAVDFFHHYKEDVKLFEEMGLQCYRTSIAWTRLFPNGDEELPDEEGVKFYNDLFDELTSKGIQPVITLSHFEMPLYLVKKYGGWENRKCIDFFVTYAKSCFELFGDRVKYWMTFNEINNQINYYNDLFGWQTSGIRFSEHENPEELMYQAVHYQFVASALAVKAAHEINEELQVGCMIAGEAFYPATSNPKNIMLALKSMNKVLFFSDVHMRGFYPSYALKEFEQKGFSLDITTEDLKILSEGCTDYVGMSYYFSHAVDYEAYTDISKNINSKNPFVVENEYLSKTDWGWQIDPIGLRYMLNTFYERYNKPIFIVENGLGAIDKLVDGKIDDSYRIDFLRSHILEMKNAIELDGVDVIGYSPWGALDMVSCTTGELKKRYGFIYVDKNDDGSGSLKRYPKDSFEWYKKVITSNGEQL